jgi:hypothetical protein
MAYLRFQQLRHTPSLPSCGSSTRYSALNLPHTSHRFKYLGGMVTRFVDNYVEVDDVVEVRMDADSLNAMIAG